MHLRIFACVAALSVSTIHAVEPPRVWTSKDGTGKITAGFYKAEGDKITVILPNGRTQVIGLQYLSDADVAWVEQHKALAAAGKETASAGGADKSAPIPAALAGKLIDDRGKPVEIATGNKAPKYYLFYYSASWCGPCRAFTPKLIQFHRKMKARKADFEVILNPSDKSLEAEIAYLKEMRMPWPALAFDQRGAKDIPRSSYGFIPAMVLVDADGKKLVEVTKDLSNDDFLEKAEDVLSGKTASN